MHSMLALLSLLNILASVTSESRVKSYRPLFVEKVIEKDRRDAYWIDTFRNEKTSPMGLVAFGLRDGQVKIYRNLSVTDSSAQGEAIQQLDVPVATDQADISADGFTDIIICYQYGYTILDTDPDGGKILWLENPGHGNDGKPWKSHYVGKSTAMHRLKIGHFTQNQRWEIIGLPIVSKPYDIFAPVPVYLFREPDNLEDARQWSQELIDANSFSVIHEAVSINNGELDSLLIASSEGINWLYFDQNHKQWRIKHIGDGETEQKQQIGFHGTGSLDVGRFHNERFAYIAAIEPFHGNTISVYVKDANTTLEDSQWTRHVLDVSGYPNENGESTGHYVVCADFDQDGDDEFLVAYRGPQPNQGVFFYKPVDLTRGIFAKWKIANESVSRIAVADFDGDDRLDFATITYTVTGYYVASNPSIMMFYNRFVESEIQVRREIQVAKKTNDIVFNVPRPSDALGFQSIPFLTVNGVTLSLVIIPPYSSYMIDKNTRVKLLFGNITWFDSGKGKRPVVEHSRTAFVESRRVASLAIESDDLRVKTKGEGALLLVFRTKFDIDKIPFVQTMTHLAIDNSLPDYVDEDIRQLSFDFVRYDQIDPSPHFRDLEFYNMKGIEINFIDTNEMLCYLQLWAAGQGVNAGVHNHRKDTFCEVHVTLINGSGEGGMHYLESSAHVYNSTTTPETSFKQLPLPTLYEHGPLWDVDENNKPRLRNDGTVVYPWHKWQAGINRSFNQSYDIWLVIEFNNKFSALPPVNSAHNVALERLLLLFSFLRYLQS